MWVISFHGGATTGPSPINTLASVQLGGSLPAMRELRGFAVGPDGNLYVVNAYKDNSLILQFGSAASSPAAYRSTFVDAKHLSHPFDLAFGPDGDLYVSNQDSNEINRFQGPGGSSPGTYVGHLVKSGIQTLRGIACDGTYWYAADETGGSGKGAVLLFDLDGNPQSRSIAVPDPVHLAYDGQRYLYIGCGSSNDVQVFDTTTPAGAPSSIFGKGGASPAIDATAGIALPGDGYIYVASRKSSQVLQYPLSSPTLAATGAVFFDQLPDQPEFIGVLGQGCFG
jgi:hypothetical protein